MSEKSNEELIEDAKNARDLNKRQVLAQAIARLDERVAESTATHEMRIGDLMNERAKLLGMMDQYVPVMTLDHIIEKFNQ